MASSESWAAIFKRYDIGKHDFSKEPFYITAQQVKDATGHFSDTGMREVRILCKQDTREQRPDIFKQNELFLLPINNGNYAILKGDGYLDIEEPSDDTKVYNSKLDFKLESAEVGNSEMQHLDFAYAVSIIRTFVEDPTLVLTIRGRKYTPAFNFRFKSLELTTKSVQTEVDAGFEGKDQIVLVEAKNSKTSNTIIRQLYYPYRQWSEFTSKTVRLLFFEKRGAIYCLWEYGFAKPEQYESIKLLKSASFIIHE